jgi:hypothetical protein
MRRIVFLEFVGHEQIQNTINRLIANHESEGWELTDLQVFGPSSNTFILIFNKESQAPAVNSSSHTQVTSQRMRGGSKSKANKETKSKETKSKETKSKETKSKETKSKKTKKEKM